MQVQVELSQLTLPYPEPLFGNAAAASAEVPTCQKLAVLYLLQATPA